MRKEERDVSFPIVEILGVPVAALTMAEAVSQAEQWMDERRGALIATAGCVLPSCIIVLTLAYMYYRFRGLTLIQGILQGLRPAVIAMIASAGLSLIILSIYGQKTLPSDLTQIQIIPILIFIVSLAVLRIRKPDPIKVMASAGAAGIVLFSLF